MQIDQTSFNDIAIFHQEEEFSIFNRLNFTRTVGGKYWLHYFFSNPHQDIERIKGTQRIIQTIIRHIDKWPADITNGTVMVMGKFMDYALNETNTRSAAGAMFYRLLNRPDYSMMKFSVPHFGDFLRGLKAIIDLLDESDVPKGLAIYMERARKILQEEELSYLANSEKGCTYSVYNNVFYGQLFRYAYKNKINELIDIFSRMDAWYSMAVAVQKFNLCFPEFIEKELPYFEAKDLYHILLPNPVPYSVQMNPEQNFMFLTGANMAGKSTLIKSVGAAVFLAHIGMGVPAAAMKLVLFDGLISNINVVDNIVKGESYFYNEVQRIKNTIEKINNGKKWLVLIDELFKGTNVKDAMKCSLTVVEGLLKIRGSIFILSTHLYEIGEELKEQPNIAFRYFETTATSDKLYFSYQLKEGISNDRLGYLILQREKVVELLDAL